MKTTTPIVLPLVIFAPFAAAANNSALDEVTVTARRMDESLLLVPAAVSVVTSDELQQGRQQLGLDEALSRVPGLFFQNRYNFAQDLRISMRGFGSRADFGIRGVKIYVDDIPATLPDGQGGVDGIDMGTVDRVEVLRGPMSAVYGTAAGGVLKISTDNSAGDPFVTVRGMLGSYGAERYQLQGAGGQGPWSVSGAVSHTDVDGYRGNSGVESTNFNGRVRYVFDDSLDLTFVVSAVDSPQADDGGALTLAEIAADRRQGRDRNILFGAGESLDQQRVGAVLHKTIGTEHDFKLRAFGLWQGFETRIPSQGSVALSNGGWVEFDRGFYGASGEYTHLGSLFGHDNLFSIGFEVASQDDDRVRYVNNNGSRGDLSFDQNEGVDTFGIHLQNQWRVTDQVSVTLGGRYDNVEFKVADHFLLNTTGDDSGSRTFERFSPAAGLLWAPTDTFSMYANASTSFETPTTTEFANPAGGGFNPALGPQKSTNYEVGFKGLLRGRLRYEAAVFTIDTSDELVAYQLPNDDRSYFENAGSSTRSGVEAAVVADLGYGFNVALSYTYSDFEYDRFRSGASMFDGNQIPGSPHHQLFGEISYQHPAGFYAIWDVLALSKLYANNANTVVIDGYAVSNIRAGYTFNFDAWEVQPYAGVNNLFNTEYFGNVRFNATFNRYYEPAPTRNYFVGAQLTRRWGS